MGYERKVGESERDFIYRVCHDKDLIGTWNEVADILNSVLGLEHDESCYRRMYKRGSEQGDVERVVRQVAKTSPPQGATSSHIRLFLSPVSLLILPMMAIPLR